MEVDPVFHIWEKWDVMFQSEIGWFGGRLMSRAFSPLAFVAGVRGASPLTGIGRAVGAILAGVYLSTTLLLLATTSLLLET
jgi:hypothetical protein